MANKYRDSKEIKIFYYSLGSHYCAVVGKDKRDISHIREAVLDHYLGECHGNYSQAEFIDLRKGRKGKMSGLCGQLIHVHDNIASKISNDKKLDDIKLELCPVNFEDHNQRKSGLHRLIDDLS